MSNAQFFCMLVAMLSIGGMIGTICFYISDTHARLKRIEEQLNDAPNRKPND